MSITLTDQKKVLAFGIEGYEYPDEKTSAPDDYNYDANWLNVWFEWTDGKSSDKSTDACLLTDELKGLFNSAIEIESGRENGYISDFMEPYLKVSITRSDDRFAVQVRYIYDTSSGPWKEFYVVDQLSGEAFREFCRQLGEMTEKYPVR